MLALAQPARACTLALFSDPVIINVFDCRRGRSAFRTSSRGSVRRKSSRIQVVCHGDYEDARNRTFKPFPTPSTEAVQRRLKDWECLRWTGDPWFTGHRKEILPCLAHVGVFLPTSKRRSS